MAHDVFISHSHTDANAAKAVCAALEEARIRCWMAPRDVLPGRDWADSIVHAVAAAKVMVLVFSAQSSSSQQVHREVTLAADAHIPILPFRIDGTPLEGTMKYYLADTHWLDAMDPPTREHIALAVSAVAALLGHQVPGPAAPATGAPVELSSTASGTLPDGAARSGRRRSGRRALVAGAIFAIALVAAGVAAYLQLTPERVAAPGPRGGTSESPASLPTYADVIDAYPSGARTVPIEADINRYDLSNDGTSGVAFAGQCKGVPISGTFYLARDYRYEGSVGPLWSRYGDTYFHQPRDSTVDEWDAYQASCRALAKKDKAWADLYDSTYARMLGPRFTSYIAASIGELAVSPGDKLTFNSDQRLVKVSAW
jgi:TIR domain